MLTSGLSLLQLRNLLAICSPYTVCSSRLEVVSNIIFIQCKASCRTVSFSFILLLSDPSWLFDGAKPQVLLWRLSSERHPSTNNSNSLSLSSWQLSWVWKLSCVWKLVSECWYHVGYVSWGSSFVISIRFFGYSWAESPPAAVSSGIWFAGGICVVVAVCELKKKM